MSPCSMEAGGNPSPSALDTAPAARRPSPLAGQMGQADPGVHWEARIAEGRGSTPEGDLHHSTSAQNRTPQESKFSEKPHTSAPLDRTHSDAASSFAFAASLHPALSLPNDQTTTLSSDHLLFSDVDCFQPSIGGTQSLLRSRHRSSLPRFEPRPSQTMSSSDGSSQENPFVSSAPSTGRSFRFVCSNMCEILTVGDASRRDTACVSRGGIKASGWRRSGGLWSSLTLQRVLLALLVALWLSSVGCAAEGQPCHKWEYSCRNGRCVPGTKYCDSINNCGDLSDEPRHCSPCNRTYYGAVGVTLDLEIHRPREDGQPFLCPLTIAAAGGELGDIVQVSFDSFTVGRFAGSGPEGGCPEGGLQIREKGRPLIGGWFCGTAWGLGSGGGVSSAGASGVGSGVAGLTDRGAGSVDGSGSVSGAVGAGTGPGRPPVFFSESDAVTLVLSLLPMSQQHQAHAPSPSAPPRPPVPPPAMSRRSSGRLHTSYDFDFRISFKMLSKEAAVVRYGGVIPSFSGGHGNFHTIQSVNGGRGDSSMEGGLAGGDDDFYFPQILHKNTNKWRSKTSGLPVLLPPLLYPLPPPALPSPPAAPPPLLHLGDLIPGTFCSRLFGGCDRRTCALQSPNYPGLYPRNLTCYFAVRQHRAPKGQVALIAVAQRRGHLMPIPTAVSPQYPSNRGGATTLEQQGHAQSWPDCDDLHDYVTVYDGYTTRDPVLLRFCGGMSGPPVPSSSFSPSTPTAISSGPELLVEFTSAPFGTLQPHFSSSVTSVASSASAMNGISGFPPTTSNSAQGPNSSPMGPASAIRGFQLQVEVRFVDQDSYLYARNKRCEFWIRPPRRSIVSALPSAGDHPTHPTQPDAAREKFTFSQLRGILRNPVHSLAANSTCVYHLMGEEESEDGRGIGEGEEGWGEQWQGRRTKPEYRIWLSVLKFHVSTDPTHSTSATAGDSDDCTSSLLVWDGALGAGGAAGEGGMGEGASKVRGRWRGGSSGTDRQWDPGCPHGFCGPPSSGSPPLNRSNYSTPLLAKYCPVSIASSPPPPSSSSASTPPRPPSCEHSLLANRSREVRPCSTRAQSGPFHTKLQQLKKPQQEPLLGTLGDPPGTTPKEGFLSTGRFIDIQMIAAESTALRPVSFAAAYEFVDLSQDGESFGDGPCSRRFSSRPPATLATVPSSPQRFTAPRNVFLYGRGGSANLSCIYRFEVQEGERVRITVVRLLTGNSSTTPPPCRTSLEPTGPYHRCITSSEHSRPPYVRLQLSDLPWHDMPVTRHCFCSPVPSPPVPTPSPSPTPTTTEATTTSAPPNTTETTEVKTTPSPTVKPIEEDLPFSYTSAPSRAVEVRFSALGMGSSHDPDSVFFEADVEFMRVEESGFFPTRQESGKGKVAPMGKSRQRKCEAVSRRRLSGPSGELQIKIPRPVAGEEHTMHCASQPYLIIPSPGRFLYVRTRGFHMMQPEGIVSLPGRVNNSYKASVPPCPTRNRLSVYSGDSTGAKLKAIICPLPPTSYSVDPRQRVELFSEGWEESSRGPPPQPSSFLPPPLPEVIEGLFGNNENAESKMSGAIVIEPIATEEGTYSISWLEVVPRRSHRPLIPPPGYPIPFLQETVDASFLPSGECIHRCPELGACINASLWCDGRPHCPSGFDESLCEHSTTASHHPLLRPPLLYASLAFLILLLLLLIALVLHLRARPPVSRHAPCPSCLPNGTAKSPSCAALDGKSGGS